MKKMIKRKGVWIALSTLAPVASFAAEGDAGATATEHLTMLQGVVTTATTIGGVVLVGVLGYFAVSLGVRFIKKARSSV